MQDLIQFIDAIAEQWSEKYLDVLRYEAAGEDSGIAFDAIRQQDGKRILMVCCFTDEKIIRGLEHYFTLGDEGKPADWSKLSLMDFIMRCSRAGGLAYEDYRDGKGRRVALAFAAAGPDAIAIFEKIFPFPK